MKRLLLILGTLLTGACCTRLPQLPEKRLALSASATTHGVRVEREVWRDEKRQRDVPVTMYVPEGAMHPVVVFSHGIGEDRDSYAWLGHALARRGYFTVHVTHAGTDRAVLERGYRHLYRAVKQRENWVNRPLDVSFVLDQLAKRSDVEMNRIAAVGHSAGAFTVFALAGLKTVEGDALKDPRIKVAIPMSMPRLDGVVAPGGYEVITIPVLNLTGTCDTSLIYRTFPRHRRIPYEESTRQTLITIEGANHDSFVIEDKHRDRILELTAGFLDAWLRDDEAKQKWFEEPGCGAGFCVERKSRHAAR